MKNDQPLDYRLRVATKRTDLPEDVIRLLADAYYEIWLDKERVQVLQDKCDSLLSTNVELEVRIKSIKEGFEGCCTACEPVGEINKKLREERDEARREVCGFHHLTGFLSGDYAISRGWDCYKNYSGEGFPQSVKDFKEFLNAHSEEDRKTIERLQEENRQLRELKMRGVVSEPVKATPPHYDYLQDLG
jgi:hypothetical protein